jgi:hypothetical protein
MNSRIRRIGLLLTFVLAFFYHSGKAQVLKFEDVDGADKRPKADFTEYHASNGQVFRVGDLIVFGEPSAHNGLFEYIWWTDGFAVAEKATASDRGWESEIIKFKIQGGKRRGFDVVAVGKDEVGFAQNYWIYIEKALSVGEIVSTVMTRSEAIAKLKEAKDLLDLEMMTQEEYDKIRKELEPIIRGGN